MTQCAKYECFPGDVTIFHSIYYCIVTLPLPQPITFHLSHFTVKNRNTRRACVYRWRVWNVLLARYKCWRCNKTECSKRCAIFIVYMADREIIYCRYFCWQLWGKSWVSCKRKRMTIYNQRGPIRGIDNNIFTRVGTEYQRQREKVL